MRWEVDPFVHGGISRSRRRGSPAGASESRSRGERDAAHLATRPIGAGEPHPEEAIQAPEPWSLRSVAEQGKLLPECQVLEREVGAGSERRAWGGASDRSLRSGRSVSRSAPEASCSWRMPPRLRQRSNRNAPCRRSQSSGETTSSTKTPSCCCSARGVARDHRGGRERGRVQRFLRAAEDAPRVEARDQPSRRVLQRDAFVVGGGRLRRGQLLRGAGERVGQDARAILIEARLPRECFEVKRSRRHARHHFGLTRRGGGVTGAAVLRLAESAHADKSRDLGGKPRSRRARPLARRLEAS